jgi:hypothetical protein
MNCDIAIQPHLSFKKRDGFSSIKGASSHKKLSNSNSQSGNKQGTASGSRERKPAENSTSKKNLDVNPFS